MAVRPKPGRRAGLDPCLGRIGVIKANHPRENLTEVVLTQATSLETIIGSPLQSLTCPVHQDHRGTSSNTGKFQPW